MTLISITVHFGTLFHFMKGVERSRNIPSNLILGSSYTKSMLSQDAALIIFSSLLSRSKQC